MRIAATIICVMSVVAAASASAAAGVADFSGNWSSDGVTSDADALYRARGSGWGDRITVTQKNGRLTVEYPFFARGDLQPPLEFSYLPDGEATVNRVMMGRGVQTQSSTARWIDGRLTVTTRHSFDLDGTTRMESEVTQTLWLESSTTLVVETTRAGVSGGPASTNRTVYRKV